MRVSQENILIINIYDFGKNVSIDVHNLPRIGKKTGGEYLYIDHNSSNCGNWLTPLLFNNIDSKVQDIKLFLRLVKQC